MHHSLHYPCQITTKNENVLDQGIKEGLHILVVGCRFISETRNLDDEEGNDDESYIDDVGRKLKVTSR